LADGRQAGFPTLLTVVAWDAASAKRQSVLIGLGLPNDAGKYETLEAVGRRLASDGVDVMAVFLSSEGWLREPRQTPDGLVYGRIVGEAVSIAGATGDGRRNLAIIPLERRPGGTLKAGEPVVTEYDPAQPDQVSGDLLTAFWAAYVAPPHPPGRGRPSGN
jgi:hypothetical protein